MEFNTPSMLNGYYQEINLINNSTNMSKIELLDKIKLEVMNIGLVRGLPRV